MANPFIQREVNDLKMQLSRKIREMVEEGRDGISPKTNEHGKYITRLFVAIKDFFLTLWHMLKYVFCCSDASVYTQDMKNLSIIIEQAAQIKGNPDNRDSRSDEAHTDELDQNIPTHVDGKAKFKEISAHSVKLNMNKAAEQLKKGIKSPVTPNRKRYIVIAVILLIANGIVLYAWISMIYNTLFNYTPEKIQIDKSIINESKAHEETIRRYNILYGNDPVAAKEIADSYKGAIA
ncbi:uncharacterized protein NESG_02118 [Nematocida ausubeli]|uniref:Uncharacterized protein n=1 Tax=Nematocida ausubeli (strain ATCC PRA-371 / ERTm2) TaxID=1913371 RepID=A0A086IZM8_NEMA1|nr:uncharacterized protein NESG_02118 [Nematocida ausubeli]KFG25346.1 hypothetical protein NESG_02118 [Nematocida ausubeli]